MPGFSKVWSIVAAMFSIGFNGMFLVFKNISDGPIYSSFKRELPFRAIHDAAQFAAERQASISMGE
jgi:hypothetical protein